MATLIVFITALAAGAEDSFTYIYRPDAHDGALHLRGSVAALERVEKELGSGRYLWFRLDGREFEIRDPAVLGEVAKVFAPLDVLDREQRILDQKMAPIEARSERLEDQIDTLSDSEERLSPQDQGRLRELEQRLGDVERELRVFEDEARQLERKERRVELAVEEALQNVARRAIRNGFAGPFP